MRRLSIIRPMAKVRNPGRRVRALRRWAASFEGFFHSPVTGQRYMNWKIPVLDRLVRPPTTSAAIQAACAQCLIDAAHHPTKARPTTMTQTRVVVVIDHPDMFGSEVCLLYDESYFQSFLNRNSEYQRWAPLPPARKLTDEWQLVAPANFAERGFAETINDPESGGILQREVWLLGDCAPSPLAAFS